MKSKYTTLSKQHACGSNLFETQISFINQYLLIHQVHLKGYEL